jgi:hypothetical protein
MTHLNAPSRHFLIAIATWRLAGKYPERRGALLFFDRVEKNQAVFSARNPLLDGNAYWCDGARQSTAGRASPQVQHHHLGRVLINVRFVPLTDILFPKTGSRLERRHHLQ